MFCNLRGLTQRGFNAATPVRRLSPPPPRFISSISAYSLSYLRRRGGTTPHIYPIKHAPFLISHFLFPSLFFFLSDHCIIQFKCAYLPHLPGTALVFCCHLYWLTCPSLWRRAQPGSHLSICTRHCGDGTSNGGAPEHLRWALIGGSHLSICTGHYGDGPRTGRHLSICARGNVYKGEVR